VPHWVLAAGVTGQIPLIWGMEFTLARDRMVN
jgi:hypothetical protein